VTSFHQCVEDNKEATPSMRAVMKKAQAGSVQHIVFYEIERVCCENCAVMYFVCKMICLLEMYKSGLICMFPTDKSFAYKIHIILDQHLYFAGS